MAKSTEVMGGGIAASTAQAMGGVYTAVTAAGSAQSDATSVGSSNTVVAGADGTKGVVLTGQAGDEIWVFNNSASTLKVYPPSGAAIAVPGTGLGTANSAFSHLTYKPVVYKFLTNTQLVPIVSA
jgi:hypothetical protein